MGEISLHKFYLVKVIQLHTPVLMCETILAKWSDSWPLDAVNEISPAQTQCILKLVDPLSTAICDTCMLDSVYIPDWYRYQFTTETLK
jgi:hypothetical protein